MHVVEHTRDFLPPSKVGRDVANRWGHKKFWSKPVRTAFHVGYVAGAIIVAGVVHFIGGYAEDWASSAWRAVRKRFSQR